MFNVAQFRQDFPALMQPSVYLDTAATALKPLAMIEATDNYYRQDTATIYRSLHQQAQRVTKQAENTREQVKELIKAQSSHHIIWTKGATESVNFVAQTYARSQLKPDDEIIVSELEHHSNLVPWLIVAQQTGAKVIKWPVNADFRLDIDTLKQKLTNKTRIVAVTQMSNVTGHQPDLAAITQLAHNHDAVVVVDGAQGIVHSPIDVTQLDIDFYLFSAHKLYGPTGLGILYVKPEHLSQLPVWHGGGKMLKTVSFDDFQPQLAPDKFEAGTPNIAALLGFSATLSWLSHIDRCAAEQHTQQLAQEAKLALSAIHGFVSYCDRNSPILSFNIEGLHHSDIAILLAEQNIAVRTGELCAQPLIKCINNSGVIRASFAPYNDKRDLDKFIEGVRSAAEILR